MSAPRPGHYWGPVVLWAGMIFALSSVATFPEEVARLLRWDKLLHMLIYAGLAFLVARALAANRPALPVPALRMATILLTVVYGISDEWHQSFVPGRFVSAVDLMYDGLGGVLGQWLWFRFGSWFEGMRCGGQKTAAANK